MLFTLLKGSVKQKRFVGDLSVTLNNPNAFGTVANDNFGFNVDVSGHYAIVGAHLEDDSSGNDSGKAYIFNIKTGTLITTLNNPNPFGTSAGDNFGFSVGISGNYAIVGAYLEDETGNTSSGKAYIFEVNTGNLIHILNNPNIHDNPKDDYFGANVCISGNYAVVGAYRESDASGNYSGVVYVYDIRSGQLLHSLLNPSFFGTGRNDYFGYSLSISGERVIVGAYQEEVASGASNSNSGVAYIFNVVTGQLLHTLVNPNAFGTPRDDYFGFSVGISGNYAIVGAYLEDEASGTNSGKAYVFDVRDGQLFTTLHNPNAFGTVANDNFGYSVDIAGDIAVVGAHLEDDSSGTSSGKVYVFNIFSGSLIRVIDNPNPYGTSANDNFGFSVAVSNGYVVVGAPLEDEVSGTNSGKVYVFT